MLKLAWIVYDLCSNSDRFDFWHQKIYHHSPTYSKFLFTFLIQTIQDFMGIILYEYIHLLIMSSTSRLMFSIEKIKRKIA